jgi:hypothetical protein
MIALVKDNIAKDLPRLDEKVRALKDQAKPESDLSEVASGIVEVLHSVRGTRAILFKFRNRRRS